jgi:ABC-type uncharacterized transport system ATPase subunit
MSIIHVQDLTKIYRIVEKDPGIAGSFKALFRPRYKDILAIDRLHFSIEPGELVGYIGVNGAGKSTTIKMLTGILVPSGGTVRVLDRDPYQQRVANARDIGVVFGQRSQLWWDLPLIESLNFVARIYELPPAQYQRRLDEFAKTLELKLLECRHCEPLSRKLRGTCGRRSNHLCPLPADDLSAHHRLAPDVVDSVRLRFVLSSQLPGRDVGLLA